MSKSKSGLNRGSPMGFIGDWDGSVLGKQGIFSQQQPVPNCKTVIFNLKMKNKRIRVEIYIYYESHKRLNV